MPGHAGPGIIAVGAIGALGLLAIFIALFIAGFFLYLGAKLVGIEKATIGKSVVAVVGGGILAMVIGIIPVLGWILAPIAYIWVVKTVFDTGWLRAFLAVIMTIVVEIMIAFALFVLMGISLSAL
ncbi:hypothetical protein A3L09_05895 [Thermococcus profundus]|uniref:Yip1 domain-containing protein n=1 Tax=Thermococcus profundus TaxID=49899 RepID=A0A2Z2M8L4_THEPR|nr:hypothetical protein [Thermococcus profundus]ASJ02820.1 hypothetical protein A3L09_05895 [Thermococcus profundus]